MELAFEDMSKAVAAYVPNVLGALAILIVGWLVARIIAAIVTGTLRRTELDNRLARLIAGDRSASAIHLEQWIGRVVFYLLMILVLVAFFETLGLTLVTEPLNRLLNQFFQFAPQLFGAAALLVIAWVLANLLRAIISRVLKAANIDQRLAEQAESSPRVSLAQTIADTAYWLVFLLFLPALLNALSLQGLLGPVQGMINKILDFLPNIFTAGLIVLVGWFLARIVRGIVTNFLVALGAERLTERVGLTQVLGTQSLPELVGLVTYVLILIPVVLAALDALHLQAVTAPTSNMLNIILATLPDILAASLIVLVAYVIGRLVSTLTTNLLSGVGFNTILRRLGFAVGVSPGQRTPAEMVGYLVFVAIMLVAATEAARQLGFTVLADLVTRFMIFAGEVVLGLIVFAIGLYLANLAAGAIETSGATHAGLLALAARSSIIVLASAMALRQMGVANDIINMAFGLLLGAVALAVALAVGLGARDVAGREVEELIRSIKAKESNNGQRDTLVHS
jgi:Mechanosensitive ion channel, conserved TM helix